MWTTFAQPYRGINHIFTYQISNLFQQKKKWVWLGACVCFSSQVLVIIYTAVAVSRIWQCLSESCCACIIPTSSFLLKYNSKGIVALTFLKSIATNWACKINVKNGYLISVILNSWQAFEGKFEGLEALAEEQYFSPLPFLHPCNL